MRHIVHRLMNRKLAAAYFMGLALFALACPACNTVEGAGEDIEAGGQGIQDAAD